jgi:hypothetical protein
MKATRKETDYFPESALIAGPLSAYDPDPFLDNLAGELTETAYGVALQHGLGSHWLDVELEIWAALTRAIKQRSDLER